MRKIRFTEHQIIAVLKFVEAGRTVKDVCREALAIEIDLNIPAQCVVRGLERIVANRGYPLKMRMDNGPELISLVPAQWAKEHGVTLEFIKPGKPTQNVLIERFNRMYRTEILDFYLLRTLNEVPEIMEHWLTEYNSERPHESLNNLTPEEHRLKAWKSQKVRGTKTGVLTIVQMNWSYEDSLVSPSGNFRTKSEQYRRAQKHFGV